ncbi:MAG: hypothetical protein COX46_02845 [bacterium (Candidatus Ratteibacteria) CG23_combo_of_CG06-09_8_20_14_all_48_7]|uniref:Methyltransferase type 11 domain-containing protein n=1 Tax=bacterium (Candidatus Ratteibacteria) CG23_combo_of_CG06-09_8_20_14_all_48_7 TaxID=2014292 RepID=A0A2G9YAU2_9BACT|nr:MAG: hypothetical protein COX46_02845 [bacterium (Candidatus Ratteibacteria) CG23_combo_of_CG06-09_8_20_14_all_48_7]
MLVIPACIRQESSRFPLTARGNTGPLSLEWERASKGITMRRDALRQTVERFGFEWTRYQAEMADEDRRTFLAETLFQPAELNGRVVLDAGCGQGRYSRIAAGFGARVIAVDASVSVEKAKKISQDFDIEYLQADLFQLPFQPGTFDYIYCLGVLHHTKDPSSGLKKLSIVLKEGGILSFWVYGRVGTPAEFKEAIPCRWKKFWLPLFLGLKLREFNSRLLRKVTTNLRPEVLYRISYLSVPLGKLRFINALLPISDHPNASLRVNDTFDWYAPKIQTHHSRQEILRWCEEAGLDIVAWISYGVVPKFGVRTKKR